MRNGDDDAMLRCFRKKYQAKVDLFTTLYNGVKRKFGSGGDLIQVNKEPAPESDNQLDQIQWAMIGYMVGMS